MRLAPNSSEETHAPGDRNQRQEVAGQPRSDQPQQPGYRAGDDETDNEPERRRRALEPGKHGSGIRRETDEGGLARTVLDERGQADAAVREKERRAKALFPDVVAAYEGLTLEI